MRRALIIGIDDYDSGDNLSTCRNDARRVTELLSKHDDDSANFQCMTLLSPPDSGVPFRPERSVIMYHARRLLEADCDFALFNFAGHGTIDDSGGCLEAADSIGEGTAIPMRDLLSLAKKSSVREVLFILDCCHAGSFGELPEFGDVALLRCGLTVLSASTDAQYAESSETHGVFTELLCAALAGGAADIAGRVTSSSVYSFIDNALNWWQQRPVYKAHVNSLATLRSCRPLVRVETLRLLPSLFTKATDSFPLDPSYERESKEAAPENTAVFARLQELSRAKMVDPIGEEYMYYAAMNSTGCELTAIGRYYWRLASAARI